MQKEKIYLSTIDENAHILAKQYGLGLEIAEFCTPWFLDTERNRADTLVREKLSCTNRSVLHGPFSELFPCAIDPKIRTVAAERYRQTVQIAQSYGIRKVVLHGGYNPRIYYPVWYQEQSVLFWKEFLKEIPDDMVICLENVFEEEPQMLAQIIRSADSPKIRMCLDVGHVNAYSQISAGEWLKQTSDLISHFHIHNNGGSQDTHSQLNDGSLSMKYLLEQMEKLCPEATVTLELMDADPSVCWLREEYEW